jgi:hypothetical protein
VGAATCDCGPDSGSVRVFVPLPRAWHPDPPGPTPAVILRHVLFSRVREVGEPAEGANPSVTGTEPPTTGETPGWHRVAALHGRQETLKVRRLHMRGHMVRSLLV